MLEFDREFGTSISKIEADLKEMEGKLKDTCLGFIMQMPEIQSIIAGDADGKSEYDNESDFWDGISKTGDQSDLTLDDLIEYISNNYTGELNGNSTLDNLFTELQSERKSVIDTCKESAEQIIKMQEEMIAENAKYIAKEKSDLEQLKQKLDKLKDIKADLEGKQLTYANNPAKKDECEKVDGQLLAIESKIDSVKAKIDMLTMHDPSNPGKTIAEHEKAQADFIVQTRKNKKLLLEMFHKHDVELEIESESENSQVSPQTAGQQQSSNQPSYQGNNTSTQEQQDVQEEETETSKPINSKEAAKNMLINLRNSSEPHKLLDDMGYGDIAAMIEYLGPLGRRELRNIISNRAKDEGIDSIEDLSGKQLDDLVKAAREIRNFMNEYGSKTSLEIANFEKDNIQKIKYACLLYDAKQGNVLRRFRQIFNRNHEEITSMKQSVTLYYDTKSQRRRNRFDLRNALRQAVGKKAFTQGAPEPARGSRSTQTQLESRNVPRK